jgi:TrmH family RNA methyltransferase
MEDWKQNVYFVLVEPTESGNIGASARAIKNMGFMNLCLINPPDKMTDEARWFARNAHDVLDSATTYGSLGEALKDKAVVVGTTRRRGKRRGVILPAEAGAERVRNIASGNKAAILFGREAKGLYNNEVDECGFMISIETSEMQPSLNLSQAVLLVAYELSKFGSAKKKIRSAWKKKYDNSALIPELRHHGDISGLYERLSGVLELLDYIPRGDRNIKENIMINLKHFIGRGGITERELNMLLGICTQIEKKVAKR